MFSLKGLFIFFICSLLLAVGIRLVRYFFSPTNNVARAIRETNKEQRFLVLSEQSDYYEIESGLRVMKNWYDSDNDFFESLYGIYVPIYKRGQIVEFKFFRT